MNQTSVMHPAIQRLRESMASVLFGSAVSIDRVICCLLARGHLLIEDVPGVGKTLLATALARSVDCSFSRIQLTPDLLPSDILGVTILDKTSGDFLFKKGPLFANIVLADEINRTPPRTQAALLEAMNEATISVDGKVYQLDQPFMVVATQNPFEFEGTYPLPENQLDRFLMRIRLGYPDAAEEARVLEVRPSNKPLHAMTPVLRRHEVTQIQELVDAIKVDRSLIEYIVSLANASRRHPSLLHGLSPRGALSLSQAARAWALMAGREYVIPEDIVENLIPVCGHRVVARGAALAAPDAPDRIWQEVLESVPSPA